VNNLLAKAVPMKEKYWLRL